MRLPFRRCFLGSLLHSPVADVSREVRNTARHRSFWRRVSQHIRNNDGWELHNRGPWVDLMRWQWCQHHAKTKSLASARCHRSRRWYHRFGNELWLLQQRLPYSCGLPCEPTRTVVVRTADTIWFGPVARCPSHRKTSPVPAVVHRWDRRQGYWTCSSRSFANSLVAPVDCQWWSVSHFRTNKWMKCNKTGPCAWSPWNRSCQEDHSEGISSHWRARGCFGCWQWGWHWSSQLVQRVFHHQCLKSLRHIHSMMHPSDVDRRRRASSWWWSSESVGRLSEVVLLEQEGHWWWWRVHAVCGVPVTAFFSHYYVAKD